MTQRLAPAPSGVANVPREFDVDLLRPSVVASVDDLLDAPRDVALRPQGRQGTFDEHGWYTPRGPATAPPVEAVSGSGRRAAVLGLVLAGTVLVGALAASLLPTSPAAAQAPIPEGVVATLVAEGFARLGVDDRAAAHDFRVVLASDPGNAAALLGLGEAMLAFDPAGARPSLCAAAERPGAVRAAALGLLEQHDIRCD
jgi:hypothetical protein